MPASTSFRAMKEIMRRAFLGFTASAALVMGVAKALAADRLSGPPPGFESATVRANGSSLHYVRGGHGPAIILIHGFPEDWVEYRAIMPRLAKRLTAVAVDLPGVGKSGPAANGYDTAHMATDIHALAAVLNLERPYIVGHDLGGLTTYAYVRQFPGSLRGAMILDVPMPGLAGSEEAGSGFWHVGFIQAPKGLAEKLVVGRQAAFLGWFYDLGKFTPTERAYFIQAYGAPQLHAAFEIYRALPKDGGWNADQTAPNSVPLVVAVGEKSFFNALLPTFVEGYRAKGMTHVESARIPDAGHYLLADNPEAVADLIERSAGN
jgi:pimeloyl-ACP methyl ester carboxylesterase